MRRTLEHMIDVISGSGDSDSVTRCIRRSLERRHARTPVRSRTLIAELVDAIGGRDSAHNLLRQLALRKQRTR